ncbi:MAG: tRNA (guanine(10)-N(2))-dimethyltransferase [Candidatus Hydrothermarchaeaceae archaeon]
MFKEITEGQTKLLVPEKGTFGATKKGGEKKAPVFYNPRMKLNRDICCAFVDALGDITFSDALAGTGAKGIRVANETKSTVILNDANKYAVDIIKKNAGLNGVNVEVFNEDANIFLLSHTADFIDVDPFGTPVPFLDNSIIASPKNGYLGVTATDTAPLCGVYPKVCYRKYGAMPLRSEFCHEVGLRILLGYVARTAAKYKRGISCPLAHSTEHYFRLYVRMSSGKKNADSSLSEMGYVYYCRACLNREYRKEVLPEKSVCSCGSPFQVSGLLWLGRIKDQDLLRRVLNKSLCMKNKSASRLLTKISEEIDGPFYYDVHKIAKLLKVDSPPMDDIISKLSDQGYSVSRTHFCCTGIKTDKTLNLPLLFG